MCSAVRNGAETMPSRVAIAVASVSLTRKKKMRTRCLASGLEEYFRPLGENGIHPQGNRFTPWVLIGGTNMTLSNRLSASFFMQSQSTNQNAGEKRTPGGVPDYGK